MTGLEARGDQRQRQLHPVLVMLAVLLATMVLTHLVPAGKFQRLDGVVTPGSYQVVPKVNGLTALLSPAAPAQTDSPARAAGIVALFAAIPAGMSRSANLIFMVMFAGGMFGVLRATGAIDAGVDRLLHLTSGNIYLLTTGLMVLLACASTFLGFMSEYLGIIPMILALGQRLRLPNLFAPIVIGAGMIGYAASVTNPIALAVAQPLAGLPVFSGLLPRLAIFTAMLGMGVGYVLFYLRRLPKVDHIPEPAQLTGRHLGVLMSLVTGGAALVAGTALWSWGSPELAAAFIAISVLLAWVGGLKPGATADAFLEGTNAMLLAAVVIGLAGATTVILQSSQILDSIVQGIASLIQGHQGGAVAVSLMMSEMVFGVLIPSVGGKAAVSMPILAPLAHLSGVSSQVTVTALLLGSGLTNMASPTNPVLLAILAIARVRYGEWLRFVAPLWGMLVIAGFAALYLMSALGI
ncbi:MAG TPA: hypothetical protein VG672_29265 [Bryobacteraceae bacterium]|nr:hypothetical protein [Bryobacteraceae bacterium]